MRIGIVMAAALCVAPVIADAQTAKYYMRERIVGMPITTATPADPQTGNPDGPPAVVYPGTWEYTSTPVVGKCSGGLKPTTTAAVCTGGACDPDAPHEPMVVNAVCGVVCDTMLGSRAPTNTTSSKIIGTAASGSEAKIACENEGTVKGICSFALYERDKPIRYSTGGYILAAGPNDNSYSGKSAALCSVRK